MTTETAVVGPFRRAGVVKSVASSVAITATGVALVAGVVYSLSPATIWLLAVIGLVLRVTAAGLPRGERRVVVALFGTAVVLRLAAIAVIAMRVNPEAHSFWTVFGDGVYALRRSLWIHNAFVAVPVAPLDYFEAFDAIYGQSGYNYLLAWFHLLVGPSPYGAHVLSVVLSVAAVAALHRIVRTSFGVHAAIVGAALVLFQPTLFLWSISPLKEAVYFCLTTLAIVSVVRACRAERWPARLGFAVCAVLLLAGVDGLRAGGIVIAFSGIVLGLAAAFVLRSTRTAIIVSVAAPLLALAALQVPPVGDAALTAVRQAASRHIGHVRTQGASYKLLDRDFYFGDRTFNTLTRDEAVPFLAKALVAFVLEPRPWAAASRTELGLVPQQIVWYLLVALAPLGVLAGLRRDPLLTMLLACTAAVGLVVIAPNSGNIGTLVRHRDMVVPFVIWLSALGATRVILRVAGHQNSAS